MGKLEDRTYDKEYFERLLERGTTNLTDEESDALIRLGEDYKGDFLWRLGLNVCKKTKEEFTPLVDITREDLDFRVRCSSYPIVLQDKPRELTHSHY